MPGSPVLLERLLTDLLDEGGSGLGRRAAEEVTATGARLNRPP